MRVGRQDEQRAAPRCDTIRDYGHVWRGNYAYSQCWRRRCYYSTRKFFLRNFSGVLYRQSHTDPPLGIALGRAPYFKMLAEQTGAAHYRQWARRFVTRRTVDRHFGRAFHQAVQHATKIHFALDGIPDIGAAVKAGRQGFRPGNFTNAELHSIMTNTRLLEKTTFYREGTVVPTPTFSVVAGEHTP